MSCNTNSNEHEEEMVARHKQASARDNDNDDNTAPPSSSRPPSSLTQHLQRQRRVFDEMSDYFATQQTIPKELQAVYHHLADAMIRILDVGCGSGALFDFLIQQRDSRNDARRRRLVITGVDLSPQMVTAAQTHADKLLLKYKTRATTDTNPTTATTMIQVVESDIMQYKNEESATGHGLFDAIVVNACFGNFWNQVAVLQHLQQNLFAGGSIVVSHPLGAPFVARLHREDPLTVPHLLPTSLDEWTALLAQGQVPLKCTLLDLTFGEAPYYFARLERSVGESRI